MWDFPSCVRRVLHKALNCSFVLTQGLTAASIFDGGCTVVTFLREFPELLKRSAACTFSLLNLGS